MQSTVCSEIRSMAVSMSYMRCFFVSPVSVGGVEIRDDVTLDRLRERREARVIAGAAQVFERSLGDVLVAVADRCRHVDICDVGRAPQGREHRADQVAKA